MRVKLALVSRTEAVPSSSSAQLPFYVNRHELHLRSPIELPAGGPCNFSRRLILFCGLAHERLYAIAPSPPFLVMCSLLNPVLVEHQPLARPWT